MIKIQFLYPAYLIIFLMVTQDARAQFSVSRIFSDQMIIQRNQVVPVWGWAEKGVKITVKWMDEEFVTVADEGGKWRIELPPMKTGGSHSMMINNASTTIEFHDILIGDVWLCSGQSNMEWTVSNSDNADEEISRAHDEGIRHFKIPHSWSAFPSEELDGGEWKKCNLENIGDFSAVGYYFAKHLRQQIDVPIGLLNSSWGGSRIEPWMNGESLGIEQMTHLEEIENSYEKERQKQLDELQELTGLEDGGLIPEKEVREWKFPEYDDSHWMEMALPSLWENGGYPGLDGVVWFRKEIVLTKDQVENGIQLHLGMIDDSDWTYVNGTMVGQTVQQYNIHRSYQVIPSILKAGSNWIAVRVEDTGGGGGIYGNLSELHYTSDDKSHSIAGDWKWKTEEFNFSFQPGFAPNQTPTVLFNKMIHPILSFPIKGALWYQGESNAGGEDAIVYKELFSKMIHLWRDLWNVGEFPFLFVQLANFMAPDSLPSESDWAVLRESQSETLNVPNTAQAVIIDIGEAADIHPRNKQDVGLRLSLAAQKLAYDRSIVYSGPVFRAMKTKEGKAILEFDHVGSGLMANDKYGYLKGFAICGPDRVFQWAKAEIHGDMVVVWHDDIMMPVAVRYAWGNNPDDANLYNLEGLPASPFRTEQ